MKTIVSKTFEEIAVGDVASVQRTLQVGDVRAWAAAFGEALAGPGESQEAAGIVTGILTALAGSALPGPGTSIRSTSVQIRSALPIDAATTARLVVREKRSDQGIVVLDGECTDPAGRVVATASLEVAAPTTQLQRQVAEQRLEGLIERCRNLEPMRTGRLISHCVMVSAATYARRFVLSDVALNIAPDTDQKRDICQNAIGFARALGVDLPKVAVPAAVEMVQTKMPATLDGAILAKMADRGQIVGGIVDWPLDLDAAVDAEAARIKHISSPVAGCADVLIVPNIEAGNMVYKNLAFMADAEIAGLVVGARAPVILTSRANTPAARRFSAAAAVLYAAALARDPTVLLPETAE
ncbi:MAG: phosphate acyltransferase [Roseiarcus sp.]